MTAPTVYSWTDIGHHDVFTPMTRLEYEWTVEQCLANVIPKLLAQPLGKRCVMLWHAASDIWPGLNDPTGLCTTWPNIAPYRTWLKKVFDGIKAAGITLNRVILDEEDGFDFWHLENNYGAAGRSSWFAALWGSAAYDRLPAYIRARPLSAYQGWNGGAIVDWNYFANSVRNRAFREGITSTVHHVFGPSVAVSNYGDSYPRFQTYDHASWPHDAAGMGNEASPECYLLWSGMARYQGGSTPAWHRRMIECVNYVRTQSVKCSPWVTFVQSDYDQTAELLGYMMEAGVSEYIYWYYDLSPVPGQHERAADVFSGLQVRPRVELPEIPFDSVSIPHLPPIVPHVCPVLPSVNQIERALALRFVDDGKLTMQDFYEYFPRRMSRGPLQKILGC